MHPQAYIEYLFHFHCTRDYFECHEILEEYWKSTNKSEPKWVGLIQVAVAMYHYRRNNLIGAARMLQTAINNIRTYPVDSLELDQDMLISQLQDTYERCQQGKPYADFNLPILDEQLLQVCKELAHKRGYTWGEQSNLGNPELVEKHRLRDRTEIIEERKKQLRLKQLNRKKVTE